MGTFNKALVSLLWLSLLIASGCSLDFAARASLNGCSDSDPCTKGVCVPSINACVKPAQPRELVVHITPDENIQPRPPAFYTTQTFDGTSLDVELPTRRTLQARVRWRDRFVPATFTVEAESTTTPPIERATKNNDLLTDKSDFDVQVELPTDGKYRIYVEPSPEAMSEEDPQTWASILPPFYTSVSIGSDNEELFINYPREIENECYGSSSRDYCLFKGQIVDSAKHPLVDAIAYVVDAENRRLSTLSHTNEAGEFSLSVGPHLDDIYLRIIREDADGNTLPTLNYSLSPNGKIAKFVLPNDVIRPIEGKVVDTFGAPVPNVGLSFSTRQENGEQIMFHRATSTSNAQGRFEATLYADNYELIARPNDSEGQLLSPSRASVQLNNAMPITITLVAQVEMKAEAFFDERQIGFQEVRLEPLSLSSEAIGVHRAVQAISDAQGELVFRADPGVYQARFLGETHGLADGIISPLTINALSEPLMMTHRMPELISGYARDFDGRSLASATVELFTRIDDNYGNRLVKIGQGRADANGKFDILVSEVQSR